MSNRSKNNSNQTSAVATMTSPSGVGCPPGPEEKRGSEGDWGCPPGPENKYGSGEGWRSVAKPFVPAKRLQGVDTRSNGSPVTSRIHTRFLIRAAGETEALSFSSFSTVEAIPEELTSTYQY